MTLNVNAPGFRLPYDLQAIYDHVAAHLLRQGRPAIDEDEKGSVKCCYRSPDGDRCAIGALIPDARYKRVLEGIWGPGVLAGLGLLPWDEAEDYSAPRTCLLEALQRLHDAAANWEVEDVSTRWEGGLLRIARDFRLRPFTRDMLNNNKE